ncbi:site-2 protease family protein [Halalkalibacillus halophilus]|uniref:site-2 protease family protein n=1 Tax=Halalkalibacillus halophilus TaxID=392827 RepID=UPI000403B594|nr:site-2 protease family protein [Halalkalibacillus halophilus]
METKFQLHPLTILLAILGFWLGLFAELLILIIIVSIHELGHFCAAKYYGWRICKIVLWPLGGVMETDDFFNHSNKEELIVTFFGPLQHIWMYGVIYILTYTSLPIELISFAAAVNTVILLFNLLPILPLDGGRVLLLVTCYFQSFIKSIEFTVMFSVTLVVIINGILIINGLYNLQILFLSVFLLLDNWFTWKNQHVFLWKHLLSRYLNKGKAYSRINILTLDNKTSIHTALKLFKKDSEHFIHVSNYQVLHEDDLLREIFTNGTIQRLGEIEGNRNEESLYTNAYKQTVVT